MITNYGNFNAFCKDSTLPVCNLFDDVQKTCTLVGFNTVNGHRIGNLGLMILSFFAVVLAVVFIICAHRRRGAVGRREMQILFFSYIIVSISAFFASGEFITNRRVLVYFSAIEIGATCATAWLLVVNAIVAYQLLPDGGVLSVGLTVFSGLAFFIGTGYIALDSAFSWTGAFDSATGEPELLRNYALYTVYLLWPIIAVVVYLILELNLVIGILHELRPMILLILSFFLFVVGQVFEFVVSKYICSDTSGKIDGSLFACLFTLFSFGSLWAFWVSITEDEYMGDL
ncbi:chitin synthase III catalytic subunit [Limtongia smithiae]|uniref:chitin synthase III catalytic subunit n=1 Tax=Limtongia smithiae TaxID=1125753 RepID=UPI0034CFBD20